MRRSQSKYRGGSDRRKMTVNLGEIYDEVSSEADRLDRSVSWLIQRAWMLAREKIGSVPSPP